MLIPSHPSNIWTHGHIAPLQAKLVSSESTLQRSKCHDRAPRSSTVLPHAFWQGHSVAQARLTGD